MTTPGPVGLVHLADLLAKVVDAEGRPAPLERTARSPWVWVTAQARRSRVDPATLAERAGRLRGVSAVAVRDDGLVLVSLGPNAVGWMVRALAMDADRVLGSPADLTPPEPGLDVPRFEAARTAEGAAPLPASVRARRVQENPVVAVQLAHSRAVRLAADPGSRGEGPPATGCPRQDLSLASSSISAATALVTELLDAPRRLRSLERPREVTVALEGVAAAYLGWEVSEPAITCRPGALVLAAATRVVLERGLALLGVHAPARM